MEEKTKDIIIGFIAGTASGIVTLYIFYNYIAKNTVTTGGETCETSIRRK